MIQFPANPVIGDVFTPGPGLSFRWNGTAWFMFAQLQDNLLLDTAEDFAIQYAIALG